MFVMGVYDFTGFCYTHRCGSRIFRTEDNRLLIPVSFYRSIFENREPPHIEYYLGESKYMDSLKIEVIRLLKQAGAKWRKECPKCKEELGER